MPVWLQFHHVDLAAPSQLYIRNLPYDVDTENLKKELGCPEDTQIEMLYNKSGKFYG